VWHVIERLRVATEQRWFHDGVLAIIVVNAAVMGAETSAEVMARHGWCLLRFNGLVQALFVLKIAVRVVAY